MKTSGVVLTVGLILSWSAASAQTGKSHSPPAANPRTDNAGTGVIGETGARHRPEFAPLTASERWRLYFVSAFGPGAILRAAAGGGIAQATGTPKEWGGGAKAYGERVGNSFAKHVIQKTIESGAAAALHEDNRYMRSTETGFWKRSKHAIGSVFVARNDAGREHFAYSRFGGALGSSFISRIWQPRSVNTSGDAAVNFGITMGVAMGWNAFREFRPAFLSRRMR